MLVVFLTSAVFPYIIGAFPYRLFLGAPGLLLDWLRLCKGGVFLERVEGGGTDAKVRVAHV